MKKVLLFQRDGNGGNFTYLCNISSQKDIDTMEGLHVVYIFNSHQINFNYEKGIIVSRGTNCFYVADVISEGQYIQDLVLSIPLIRGNPTVKWSAVKQLFSFL